MGGAYLDAYGRTKEEAMQRLYEQITHAEREYHLYLRHLAEAENPCYVHMNGERLQVWIDGHNAVVFSNEQPPDAIPAYGAVAHVHS